MDTFILTVIASVLLVSGFVFLYDRHRGLGSILFPIGMIFLIKAYFQNPEIILLAVAICLIMALWIVLLIQTCRPAEHEQPPTP